MTHPIAKTIEVTLEARPTLAERFQRMEEAYASIPEGKREFYKFVFWLLVTLHDVGTHTSASSIATIQARKQFAYCAHEQLAHFCTVLGFPKRNLAKLAEHLDKFIAWFRNHGIEVPKEDALTLLGYITKAEKQYAALAEKEAELNGKKGRHASTSNSRGKDKVTVRGENSQDKED